jgi:hypothetical protein
MTIVRPVVLVALLGLAPAADIRGAGDGPRLDVVLVATGLVAPLDLTFAPDGSGRRFIVDQTGLVHVLTPGGRVLPDPFLDITDRVVLQSAFDERGLLALAFHPRFGTNGKLYVHYSARREGENICVDEEGRVPEDPPGCPLQYTRRVSEFTVSPEDPDQFDPGSERVVSKIQWPGRKHNGGGLAFGPDGMLYIGLGDAGFIHGPSGADDPFNVDPICCSETSSRRISPRSTARSCASTSIGAILTGSRRTTRSRDPTAFPTRSTPGGSATRSASRSIAEATGPCT